MRYFNVCVRANYSDPKDGGKQKFKWLSAGSMRITDAGGYYLTLNHQPDVQMVLFERIEPTQQSPVEIHVSDNDREDPDVH